MPTALRTEVSPDLIVALWDANQCAPLDLHPGNIVFANTTTPRQSDTDLMMCLGKPKTGDVQASHGCPLTPQIPKYLVSPTSLPFLVRDTGSCLVKIIDFGEAFLPGQQHRIHCPLVFRAPEAVLTTQSDLQADIWSLSCTVCASYDQISKLLIGGKDIRADRRTSSFR